MKEDKRVDEEYQAAARTLLTFMMEDTRNISRCMSVMWVLRSGACRGPRLQHCGERDLHGGRRGCPAHASRGSGKSGGGAERPADVLCSSFMARVVA